MANDYLLSPLMVKLNKDNGKNKFIPKEVGESISFEDVREQKELEKSILEEIKSLGGAEEYGDIKMSDEDNKHVYSGKTLMESDDFDFAEFMKTAIKVFSQLDQYAENMAYLEREADLDIMDFRHFKRKKSTKMNSISASKLEYIEQKTERKRKEFKQNRLISQIVLKDINRIKNDSYVNVIDNILESEYRYRRNSEDKIKAMIASKKPSELKVV